jgi:hypothetical protein
VTTCHGRQGTAFSAWLTRATTRVPLNHAAANGPAWTRINQLVRAADSPATIYSKGYVKPSPERIDEEDG